MPDPAAAYRDLDTERMLLTSLDRTCRSASYGLSGHVPAFMRPENSGQESVRLSGIETMRFTTEMLPLLADHPWILVEITGQPADYRAADDSLRIGVSAGAVAGDTDWFDLGVTILVEGHEIPFAELFLALSQGQTCLLLDDGAYFSLEKPELQALARLIEEARGLQDAPPSDGSLRISRFQAGLWQELTEIGVVTSQAVAWERQVDGLLVCRARGAAQPSRRPRATLRPYQLDGLPVAGVPVAAPARRHPGRRHGPGQDPPVPGPDRARPAGRARPAAVPDRRPDQRRVQLGRRVRPVHPPADRRAPWPRPAPGAAPAWPSTSPGPTSW